MPASVCIELAPSAADQPFAEMMATLLRQNLDDHPEKQATALRMSGRVAIAVTDLDVTITLACGEGRLTLHGGLAGIPDVMVRASSEWVAKMSLVELVPGPVRIPNPRGAVAKELAEAEARGEIRTFSRWTAYPLLLRLTEVLSIH